MVTHCERPLTVPPGKLSPSTMIKHSLSALFALSLAQTALAATPEQIARAAL